MIRVGISLAAVLAAAVLSATAEAWGGQGHRLVASLASTYLTPGARQAVGVLLDDQTMADVAVWADVYLSGVNQTSFWHYVNIPTGSPSYERDRDCPRQPGVAAGSAGDAWRDCIVDRIRYNEERVADTTLDRADRAIALKFLIHFVGDIHQPLHASAVARGGNDIALRFFVLESCPGSDPSRPPRPCNLHGVWDTQMIARRGLDDRRYLALLEDRVGREGLLAKPVGTPAEWAIESLRISERVMLPQRGEVTEGYYQAQLPVIDGRLALAGVRLALLLNRSLDRPAPSR